MGIGRPAGVGLDPSVALAPGDRAEDLVAAEDLADLVVVEDSAVEAPAGHGKKSVFSYEIVDKTFDRDKFPAIGKLLVSHAKGYAYTCV